MKKQFTLVELLIVVGIIAVIIAIAIPGLLRARISSNETATLAALKTITTSEATIKRTFLCDQDGDGEGEYGFFSELSGITLCRGSGNPATPPFLSVTFGSTASTSSVGNANKSGYLFVLYLPTELGPAITETVYPLPSVGLDADPQETRFACYAWPQSAGNSGRKAFFTNQLDEILYCSNFIPGTSIFLYSANSSRPQPQAIFDAANLIGAVNLEANLTPGVPSVDGQTWLPTN